MRENIETELRRNDGHYPSYTPEIYRKYKVDLSWNVSDFDGLLAGPEEIVDINEDAKNDNN